MGVGAQASVAALINSPLRVHVTARVLNFLFLALVPFLYTVMDPEFMWLAVLKFDRFRDYCVNGRQKRTTV